MIVQVLVGPAHETLPLVKVGVTTIVPVMGVLPVLVAVKDILLLPLAPRPILVLSLVQAYVVVPPVFVVA